MQLSDLKPTTKRPQNKRIGRGGKRGTTSGKGTKGQKSRAGAGVRPGFRGGDNRIWQLFPKLRGASKKADNKSPHHKHRFFRVHQGGTVVIPLSALNVFNDGDTVTAETLAAKGIISSPKTSAKILGNGALNRKLAFKGVRMSVSVRAAIEKAKGSVE